MGNKATKPKSPKPPLDFFLCVDFDKKIENPSEAIDRVMEMHRDEGFAISREHTIDQNGNHIAILVRGTKTSLSLIYITLMFSDRVDRVNLIRAPEKFAQSYCKDADSIRLERAGTPLAAQKA